MKSNKFSKIILLLISISFIRCTILKPQNIISSNNNVIFIINLKPKIYNEFYVYKFDDSSINDVMLRHEKYKNFDNRDIDLKMLNFKINKSFLRKNRDIILTEKKIKKMGREKFIRLLYDVDMVFLIDGNLMKNNQVTIMEVNFSFNSEE